MTFDAILFFALAGCGLFAIGLYIEEWTRPKDERAPDPDEMADDELLFIGWDWLTPAARRQRLALYQRRVQTKIAKQERAWLRERPSACAKR
ncbi:hypothetical protein [Azotobacter salinestris]|uniref:hypothetical protein n=1 Tax=Azotobacter salinestris TaxID=69964 RepID=UPI001266DC4F|nr:hypothetical protein [Azotobacter salinestris]